MNSLRPCAICCPRVLFGSTCANADWGETTRCATQAVMASQAPTPCTCSCGRPAFGGSKALTLGSASVLPSLTISPAPPDTPRILSSKSWISSKIAESLSTRWLWSGSAGLNVPFSGMVRRGPEAKAQTTPSDRPSGWQLAHDCQPCDDMRPETPSSKVPTEVLNK